MCVLRGYYQITYHVSVWYYVSTVVTNAYFLTPIVFVTYRCTEPAPRDCQPGSLKHAFDVDGGTAYSVCTCDATTGTCAYTPADPSQGTDHAVVMCDAGRELRGASPMAPTGAEPQGKPMLVGGQCSRIKRGTSGGMVFFWCLFSVALAAGGVVGGKYGWEWYQTKRVALGAGYVGLGWDAFTNSRARLNDSW